MEQRRASPLRRSLACLAVVIGVLGMHALSGGPHSMSSMSTAVPSLASSVHMAMPAVPGPDEVDVHGAGGGSVLLALAARTGTSVNTMTGACLAVLLGLVLLLVPRLLARASVLRRASPGSGPAFGRTGARGPPPDLLTLVCVMRT